MQIDIFKGRPGVRVFLFSPSVLSPGGDSQLRTYSVCCSPVGLGNTSPIGHEGHVIKGASSGWQEQKLGHQTCAQTPFREKTVTWDEADRSQRWPLLASPGSGLQEGWQSAPRCVL